MKNNKGMTFLLTTLYPAQKHCGMTRGGRHCPMTVNGFTLIELLVVVLIIGILAAVAVPQYQKAVEKTRFANYVSLANSLISSIQVSYMAKGSWPTSFDELAVNLPTDMTTENTIRYGGICRKNSKNYCCIVFPSNDTIGAVICGDTNYNLATVKKFASSDGTSDDNTRCFAKNEPYLSACKAISGKTDSIESNLPTPNGWISGYSTYMLN